MSNSNKIKCGEVPDYIISSQYIQEDNVVKILNSVKELCCNEYIEYLKMIPMNYLINSRYTLVDECAKNHSILATEHILKNQKISQTILIKLLRVVLSTNNNFIQRQEYINWILENQETNNEIAEISGIFEICIKNNDLQMFLKLYQKLLFNNSILFELFEFSYISGKINFLEIIYELIMVKGIVKYQTFYKTLLKESICNTDCFIWLFNKLSDTDYFKNINTVKIKDDLTIIYTKNYCDLDKLKFIESKIDITIEDVKIAFDKIPYSFSHIAYTKSQYNPIENLNDKIYNTFVYLFSKIYPIVNNDYFTKYFSITYLKAKHSQSEYMEKICEFLIENTDIELTFGNKYYDLFNNKKQIQLKKIRQKYLDEYTIYL